MSDYEKERIEYEIALNAANDRWFYAREKSVERSPNSEFIYAGGFRMAWEQMQAENYALTSELARAKQALLREWREKGSFSNGLTVAAEIAQEKYKREIAKEGVK